MCIRDRARSASTLVMLLWQFSGLLGSGPILPHKTDVRTLALEAIFSATTEATTETVFTTVLLPPKNLLPHDFGKLARCKESSCTVLSLYLLPSPTLHFNIETFNQSCYIQCICLSFGFILRRNTFISGFITLNTPVTLWLHSIVFGYPSFLIHF